MERMKTSMGDMLKHMALCAKCDHYYHPSYKDCPNCAESRYRDAIMDTEREAENMRRIAALGGHRAHIQYTKEGFFDRDTLDKTAAYPRLNLYLYGPPGSGKTHLATALVRDHYPKFRIVKPMDITREIRENQCRDAEEDIINKYAKRDMLVIDDLGAEKATEFSVQTIYEIVDRRYMDMSLGLIITSNLSLEQLAEKTGNHRISSRLAGMCRIIKLADRDWRIARRKEAQ